jgi:flagellar protein FlbT
MKSKLKIALKPGEKIYVNGAVLSVDRKVSLEFLNDVQFLLQSHVMQPEDATSPLRQLYFIVQIILMNPDDAGQARELFRNSLPILLDTFSSEAIRSTLKDVDRMVAEGETFEALRTIRGLFKQETGVLHGQHQHASMGPLEAAE